MQLEHQKQKDTYEGKDLFQGFTADLRVTNVGGLLHTYSKIRNKSVSLPSA